MTLFFSLLPLYLLGNLHCIGMCGPLVMLIGQHRYRYFYFAGRTVAFTLAGAFSGQVGAVLNHLLNGYQIPATTSLLFGGVVLMLGIYGLLGWNYPGQAWLAEKLKGSNRSLSLLILKDKAWPTFLFGFFTLLLPCGQTLIVFSACALAGDLWIGLFNGAAFAILTSPSLFFAMQARTLLGRLRPYYHTITGSIACLVGLMAMLRGFAEIEWIDHWILNPNSPAEYHLVIY